MKKLSVTIQIDMLVPDDWEVVETSEGTPVIKRAEGQYLDLAIEPLFAHNPEDVWTGAEDDESLNEILDMVETEAVMYEFITH